MSRSVLIAALSGRALAQSAKRAGLLPLVVDAFGDCDLRDAAAATRLVEPACSAAPLLSALEGLARAAPHPPIGLVLGAGFEDRPRLLRRLAAAYPLIGTDPAAIAMSKDPRTLADKLRDLNIAHPEITFYPPPGTPDEWLSKRVGGTGGCHVRIASRSARAPPRGRYFQRRIDGEPMSVLAIADEDRARIVGFSRQWTNPVPGTPFRYGGAVGPVELPSQLRDSLSDITGRIAAVFDLRGLFSLDFLVDGTRAAVLEINPRPGASLDIFDDAAGSLFAAHVEPSQPKSNSNASNQAGTKAVRAAAYLYADRGTLTVGDVSWPDWAADRPMPGTTIRLRAPIATVFAAGPDETTARARLPERLALLDEMLYGRLPM